MTEGKPPGQGETGRQLTAAHPIGQSGPGPTGGSGRAGRLPDTLPALRRDSSQRPGLPGGRGRPAQLSQGGQQGGRRWWSRLQPSLGAATGRRRRRRRRRPWRWGWRGTGRRRGRHRRRRWRVGRRQGDRRHIHHEGLLPAAEPEQFGGVVPHGQHRRRRQAAMPELQQRPPQTVEQQGREQRQAEAANQHRQTGERGKGRRDFHGSCSSRIRSLPSRRSISPCTIPQGTPGSGSSRSRTPGPLPAARRSSSGNSAGAIG